MELMMLSLFEQKLGSGTKFLSGSEERRSIKYILLAGLFFLTMLFQPHSAEAVRATNVKIGRGEAVISYLDGSAQMMPKGKDVGQTLKINDKLLVGAEINTGSKTKLELILPDKSLLRFADNSRFKLVQLEAYEEEPRAIKVHVAIGKAWANVSKSVGGNSNFSLTCENAIAGVRGTVFRLNVDEDKSALVRVYDGTVAVVGGGKLRDPLPVAGPQTKAGPKAIAGPKTVPGPKAVTMKEWTFIIKAMQEIAIRGDGTPGKPKTFTEQEDRDTWAEWNKARDRQPD